MLKIVFNYFDLSYAVIIGIIGFMYTYLNFPKLCFKVNIFFIIHIFKIHLCIVKNILHLNLKFNEYNILVRFKEGVMFTSTEFKTNLFYRHKTTHYALKHLILLEYRVIL